MEPNKFDNEIREKLLGRAINPSPMAWDRLDAMLSVAEGGAQASKKPNRAWMYMAACFLVMLSVGGFLLLDGNSTTTNTNGSHNGTGVVSTAKQAEESQNNTVVPQAQGEAVATTTIQQTQGSSSSKSNAQKANQVLATPFHPLPAEYGAQQTAGQTVAVQENSPSNKISVDAAALLASVQSQKAKPINATQPGIRVSANELLTGIDGEMENNFRGRMLQRLEKNYNEVKDAVASRNYN